MVGRLARGVLAYSDLLLFLVLIVSGLWIIAHRPWGFDPAAAASLAGALFGGAALLLGNWINRYNELYKAKVVRAEQIERLKALIAAELVNVA